MYYWNRTTHRCASPSVRLLAVSENTHNSWTTCYILILFCKRMHAPPPPSHSTGRRFCYAHGDLGFSLKPRKRRLPHDLETWRLRYAYNTCTLPLCSCYDPTTTMKIWLRLVYADGDVVATLLRPWRWSYAFVALLYPFYIESDIPIRFYYDIGASTALLPLLLFDQNFES